MLRHINKANTQSSVEQAPAITLIENVSRRHVLKGITGFSVAMQVMPALAFDPYPHGGQTMPHGVVNDPHVFVSIDASGTVTIVAHRSEMGTGARTTIPMIIAEEMDADWERVRIVQAEGDEPKYGNQDTDGSRSLRHSIQPAREIGASVRRMMEEAAALTWGVDVSEVHAELHQVTNAASGRSLGYGELAEAAMSLDTPPREMLDFKDEADFRYIGKGEVQIYDLHDITTGKAIFGADVKLPGMKYAMIVRPPAVGAQVLSVDEAAALAIEGVERIVRIPVTGLGSKFQPKGGVAVIASNTWAAIKARQVLNVKWENGIHGVYNTPDYEAQLRRSVSEPGKPVRNQGNADQALAGSAKVFTREYYQAHMAHAPMEPPVAIANYADGMLEIWAPVQSPYVTRTDIAELLQLTEDQVKVNVTLLGGGFGRKSKADFAAEAAYLSREIGSPVRVQWTREDDLQHGYYHTTSVEKIDVGLDENDKVIAWRHRSAAPSFLTTFSPDEGFQNQIEIGMGLEDLPYEVEHISAEQCRAMAHTRVGWFRAVSNIPRAFATQSITAELAGELGRDEKDFLLELIGSDRKLDWQANGLPQPFWNNDEPYEQFPFDTARLKRVINEVADMAGWGRSMPEGEALGIAAHRSFVSYVATVVHVKMVGNQVTVPETWLVVDAGFVANPERVRSQMEGACVFGMTAAMHSGIHFNGGAVQETNFHNYPLIRNGSYPLQVNTRIIEQPFAVHAAGVGEPGVPPFIPALTNAIYKATGTRIRDLPIGRQLS